MLGSILANIRTMKDELSNFSEVATTLVEPPEVIHSSKSWGLFAGWWTR